MGALRRAAAVVFPGSRWVWFGALVVVLLGSFFFARYLAARTATLTGTNSVDVAAVVAHAEAGQKACVRDLVVPKGTGRVETWLGALEVQPGARLHAWISDGRTRLQLLPREAPAVPGFTALALPRPLDAELDEAELCLRPERMSLDFGGASVQRLPGSPVTRIGAAPLEGLDIGVRFLRAEGHTPRVGDAFDEALRRATLFESGVGTILLWLALPSFVALLYLVVRIAATVERWPVRRLAVAAAVVTFVHGAAWAVLLHPFHGADESEHFAYAQHLAATGQRADAERESPRPPYSSSQVRLLQALHHNSTVLNASSRLRWEDEYEAAYRAEASGTTDTDGGGFTESGSGHSPLYYFVIGLPYRVLGGAVDLPAVLLVMRLLNALLAAGVAALAVLTAATLFGASGRPMAWLAGSLAGLQPVFGSVAGAINNDTAVNLAAAALLYVLVDAWARRPGMRSGAVTGLLMFVLPVAKITGFALLPVVAFAAVPLALRHGLRRTAAWLGTAVAVALVAAAAWIYVLAPVTGGQRGAIVNVHPSAPSTGAAEPTEPTAAGGPALTLRVRAEYFLQTLLPWPTIGADRWALTGPGALERWPFYEIYIERGYGLFGWKSTSLSGNVLRGIFAALAAGWLLALVAAVKRRRRWRDWLGGVAILAAAIVGVLALVAFGYASTTVRAEPGEQGRYAFTAMVSLAVLLSAALFAVRGRLREVLAGVGAASAATLALVAWTGALRGWFM